MSNFNEVTPLYYWVQKVLPLVYDDSLSFYELLNKVVKKLNELVANNAKLPDFIRDLIEQYITSGAIEAVISNILANYMLNVKFPPSGLTPASGDGTKDDTEAIQGCIDYAFSHGGMAVYFPSGSYLTQSLTLKNKATLFGQDRYTTRLVMKGGAVNPMFSGNVGELTLSGLGFDGNMDIQVNNVNLFTITVNSAIINNCLLTDGYCLLDVTVNNDLQIDNTIFNHSVDKSFIVNGGGYVQASNLIFNTVSTLIGENFIVLNTSKSILSNIKCNGTCPNALLIGGNDNTITFTDKQSVTPFIDNGINNTVYVNGKTVQLKLTDNYNETILGNKTVNTNNYTVNTQNDIAVEGNSLNIAGDSIVSTFGSDIETISGLKKINSDSYEENITTSKTVSATTLNEDISETKTITAKNLKLNVEQPITYRTPSTYNEYFKKIDLKDSDGVTYPVLVGDENTGNIPSKIDLEAIEVKIDKLNSTVGPTINNYDEFLSLTERKTQGGWLYNTSVGQGEVMGASTPYIGVKSFFDSNGGFNEFDNRHINEFARIGAWKWNNHDKTRSVNTYGHIYIVNPASALPTTITVTIEHNGAVEFLNGSIKKLFSRYMKSNQLVYSPLIKGGDPVESGDIPFDGSYTVNDNKATITFNPANLINRCIHFWFDNYDDNYDSFVSRVTMSCNVPNLIGFNLGSDEVSENGEHYEQCGTASVIVGNCPRSLTLYNDFFNAITRYGDYHNISVKHGYNHMYYEGSSFIINKELLIGSVSTVYICSINNADFATYTLLTTTGGIFAKRVNGNFEDGFTFTSTDNTLNTISGTGYLCFDCQFVMESL